MKTTERHCRTVVFLRRILPSLSEGGSFFETTYCTAQKKAPLTCKGSGRPQGRLRGFEGIDDRSSCPLYGHCPSPPPHCRSAPPLHPKGRLCGLHRTKASLGKGGGFATRNRRDSNAVTTGMAPVSELLQFESPSHFAEQNASPLSKGAFCDTATQENGSPYL